MSLLVIYFLWEFASRIQPEIFGYSRPQILTYVLGGHILRSVVLAIRSADIHAQISSGDLSNFLLKPMSYFKYWVAKDFADKVLNLGFVFLEILLIVKLFNVSLFAQQNLFYLSLFLVALPVAMALFFFVSLTLSLLGFWMPENPWPTRFLFNVVTEILAGGLFPLDILPVRVFMAVKFLPTSFFLFGPLNIYLGRLSINEAVLSLGLGVFWLGIFYYLARVVWLRGLRVYTAEGR